MYMLALHLNNKLKLSKMENSKKFNRSTFLTSLSKAKESFKKSTAHFNKAGEIAKSIRAAL